MNNRPSTNLELLLGADGRSPLTSPLEQAPPCSGPTAATAVHDQRLDGHAALVGEGLRLLSLRKALPDAYDAAAKGRRAHLRCRRSGSWRFGGLGNYSVAS